MTDPIPGLVNDFWSEFSSPVRIQYCLSHRAPGPFLAARFAAKEAVSKAFGTGIGAQLGWQDIEVAHRPSGEPYVIFHDKGLKLMAERRAARLLISLSHTQGYAAAVAVLEGDYATVS